MYNLTMAEHNTARDVVMATAVTAGIEIGGNILPAANINQPKPENTAQPVGVVRQSEMHQSTQNPVKTQGVEITFPSPASIPEPTPTLIVPPAVHGTPPPSESPAPTGEIGTAVTGTPETLPPTNTEPSK